MRIVLKGMHVYKEKVVPLLAMKAQVGEEI
jgi:hypothetical protein